MTAALYLEPHPASPEPHRRAFRALLQLHPIAYRQLPHVLG